MDVGKDTLLYAKFIASDMKWEKFIFKKRIKFNILILLIYLIIIINI